MEDTHGWLNESRPLPRHEETEQLLTREGDLSVSIGARNYTPHVLDVHIRYWSHKGDFVQWLQRDEALALLEYLKRYEGVLRASEDADSDEPFASPRKADIAQTNDGGPFR